MADPADINVDELRRRARRRLVGAIVLALAAAVVVPMLLESEPKPLGESVAVKIPPVDDGKFVNRLSDGAPKADAPAKEPRKDGAIATEGGAARKSLGDAEKAVVAPPAKAPRYDTQIASDRASSASAGDTASKDTAARDAAQPPKEVAIAAPKDAVPAQETAVAKDAAPARDAPPKDGAPVAAPPPAAPASTAAPASAPAPAKADAKSTAAPRSDTKSPAPPVQHASAANGSAGASAPVAKDGFSVQLAAFSDDKGANSLASRLKGSGYPAYTEPLKTSRGTLWRVRVGPYATRDAANGVRDKLKTEGQNGIVAPSR